MHSISKLSVNNMKRSMPLNAKNDAIHSMGKNEWWVLSMMVAKNSKDSVWEFVLLTF